MSDYIVPAKRVGKWWELYYNNRAVTQSRTLDGAEKEFRDWLATTEDRDTSKDHVVIVADLGATTKRLASAQTAAKKAAQAQENAGAAIREIVRRLHDSEQLSYADLAHILGVSKARAAQLLK